MKLRLFAWLILVFGFTLCRGAYFENVFYNVDEAEYAVAADGLSQGWLSGVDFLGSTKPPAIVLLYKALFLFGRNLTVIHVAHLLIMIAIGMIVIELAVLLWNFSAAVPAAIFFWMISNSFSLPSEIIALNVESPGILCALLAVFFAMKSAASDGNSASNRFLLAGIFLGLAALFRQSLVLFSIPVLFYLEQLSAAQKSQARFRYFIGTISSWLIILVWYALHDGLGWAFDSWIIYPLTYAGDFGADAFIEALFYNSRDFFYQCWPVVLFAIGGAGLLYRREKSTERMVFLFIFGIASLLALFTGSRFFGHYWITVFPLFALLAIPLWFEGIQKPHKFRWLAVGILSVGIIMAAVHFPLWRLWDDQAPPEGFSHNPLSAENTELKIAKFAADSTRSDETICVWGYCPQIYYYAKRLPGVRDYLCHYITGYSVGAFDPQSETAPRENARPDAEEMFVEDLITRRPKYIFDLVQIQDYDYPFYQYSLRRYPRLAEYLHQSYLPEGQIDNALIYRLRSPDDKWFPQEQDIK